MESTTWVNLMRKILTKNNILNFSDDLGGFSLGYGRCQIVCVSGGGSVGGASVSK